MVRKVTQTSWAGQKGFICPLGTAVASSLLSSFRFVFPINLVGRGRMTVSSGNNYNQWSIFHVTSKIKSWFLCRFCFMHWSYWWCRLPSLRGIHLGMPGRTACAGSILEVSQEPCGESPEQPHLIPELVLLRPGGWTGDFIVGRSHQHYPVMLWLFLSTPPYPVTQDKFQFVPPAWSGTNLKMYLKFCIKRWKYCNETNRLPRDKSW